MPRGASGSPSILGSLCARRRGLSPVACFARCAIELVEAIDVDIDAIPPPVEVAPNRRADGNRGGKRQYAATGEAGRIPIVGFVLWVGPTPARDGVAMRAVTLSVLFRIAPWEDCLHAKLPESILVAVFLVSLGFAIAWGINRCLRQASPRYLMGRR